MDRQKSKRRAQLPYNMLKSEDGRKHATHVYRMNGGHGSPYETD
jgi:hypothetical protein